MFRVIGLLVAIFGFLATASAQPQYPSDSRLKTISDSKTIRIAYRTDATPFAFANDKHEAVGFSVEYANRSQNRSRNRSVWQI